jgi:hypothetical protein
MPLIFFPLSQTAALTVYSLQKVSRFPYYLRGPLNWLSQHQEIGSGSWAENTILNGSYQPQRLQGGSALMCLVNLLCA